MKPLFLLLGLLFAIAAVATVFVYSGAYNVAADEPHWAPTRYVIEATRARSIAARASDIAVPNLTNEALIRAGAGNYNAMCTGCYLKPGLEMTEQSNGLYPSPPDLTKKRPDDPAIAFWTIKHGIKMTGMPAWGRSMDDQYIWGMVAFLLKLPDLTEDQYDALVSASSGHQHGGSETAPASSTQGAMPDAADHSHENSHTHAAEPHSHDDDHSGAAPHKH